MYVFFTQHFTSGDEVKVIFDDGSITTPLREGIENLYNGFNGFRI